MRGAGLSEQGLRLTGRVTRRRGRSSTDQYTLQKTREAPSAAEGHKVKVRDDPVLDVSPPAQLEAAHRSSAEPRPCPG